MHRGPPITDRQSIRPVCGALNDLRTTWLDPLPHGLDGSRRRGVRPVYSATGFRRLTIQHPTDDTTSPATVSPDRGSPSSAQAINAAVPGTR